MTIFKKVEAVFDAFVFDSFKLQANHLGLYRILYCVFTFLFYGIPNYVWIGGSPDYLFKPPSISLASLFNGFPSTLFFTLLNIAIVILYFVLFFGWHTKITSLLLFFFLLVGQSFSFSFGKVDHTIIWLVIPLVMAFSGWGNAYSIDATVNQKKEVNSWAISLMALLLGFAMFTASLPKIIDGWLSIEDQATRSHIIFNYLYWERRPILAEAVLHLNSVFFWELLDYLTTLFEFGFLFAILKPNVFRCFIVAAVLFHISVFLTLGILFTSNLITYLVFINWSIFNPLLKSRRFNSFVLKFINQRNLLIVISGIVVYSITAFIIHKDFIFPSVLRLITTILSIKMENLNANILFSLALVFTLISAYKYFRDKKVTTRATTFVQSF